MNSLPIMVGALCVLAIGYRYYSAFIAARVLPLDDTREMPSRLFQDDHNYLPMNKWVLFGHHFAAIAGAGPLVGPVLAAQFGYAPGLLWLLAGAVLLQVESYGEAWYLNPADGRRYYLGRPRDARLVIQSLARPIEEQALLDYLYFDKAFPTEFSGYFVYSAAEPDDYYYVTPPGSYGHLLRYPDDSFQTLVGLGTGIKNELIRKIPVGELPK